MGLAYIHFDTAEFCTVIPSSEWSFRATLCKQWSISIITFVRKNWSYEFMCNEQCAEE